MAFENCYRTVGGEGYETANYESCNAELGEERRDRRDRKDKEESNKQIAFGSGTGAVGPLPIITTLLADPLNVVTASVDCRGMRDVSNHLVFTSIIALPLGISVTLNFQITRIGPDGCPIKVGGTYTFATLATALEAESFSFQFTDRNLKPGNYTYSIDISTNSIIDITPGLTVNNATLAIFAVND